MDGIRLFTKAKDTALPEWETILIYMKPHIYNMKSKGQSAHLWHTYSNIFAFITLYINPQKAGVQEVIAIFWTINNPGVF